MTMFQMVGEFHEVMGLRKVNKPEIPDVREREFRLNLIREEITEYLQAEVQNDIAGIAAELCDLLYVLLGTGHAYGIPVDEIFAAIHKANMAKAPGGVVQRREDGKILKPEGWEPANVAGILNV